MTAANGANDGKGIVTFEGFSIKPAKEVSITELKEKVERYFQDGEMVSDNTKRALTLHLTAVERYVKNEEGNKVVKHLKGFKQLLKYQLQNKFISEQVYQTLKEDTAYLIGKYQ